MPDCEKLKACAFFNDRLPTQPGMTDVFKTRYCRGNSTNCARLMVSKVKGTVPDDLFPNDFTRANKLIGV